MNEHPRTIVLVLKNGKGFSFRDVKLIVNHIHGKWESEDRPRIICLWDRASEHYSLGNFELIPLKNGWIGTWSRMVLYSPEMEQFRPFLYIDLDTAIIQSLERIFDLVKDPSKFITLEDFYQPHKLATALVWVPANSYKVQNIWKQWRKKRSIVYKSRMDFFLRKVVQADIFWQDLTNTIHDFKPSKKDWLSKIPRKTSIICFHGKPRIYDAVEKVKWIKEYVLTDFQPKKKVTVIIPYKEDRGWLQQAIDSVPSDVQLILSKGKGNWPQNFNKVLDQVEGDFIKYLHEDDMLTENCIRDSVHAIESQNVDFIHGNALEIYEGSTKRVNKRPRIHQPTLQDLLAKNVIHSPTVMYRRGLFEAVGRFDESLTICEEYEFHLRCLHKGMKIGYCPTTLAYYRRHPKQNIRITTKEHHKREKAMVKSKYV